jgi:hypothetical protein
MANGFHHKVGTLGSNSLLLTGVVTLGSSGALSTTVAQTSKGFTVAKTGSETGRYTATLHDAYGAIEYADCKVEVGADAAVTDQKGAVCVLRGVDAAGKVAYFQFLGWDGDGDAADREPIDSAKLRFFIVANTGKL